jgi:hypothetical protein
MEAINTQITKFDENLKSMIVEKINKELEASISNIIKTTYDNVIGLQCNEYLSNNSSFDLITNEEYKKLRSQGVTESKEDIMWYTYFDHCYSQDYCGRPSTTLNNIFIIYNNGLIDMKFEKIPNGCNIKNKSWHLNYEPSLVCVNMLKLAWSYYNSKSFCAIGYRLYRTQTELHMTYDNLLKGIIEPIIEIFKNQKPYQFNTNILKILSVEKQLKEKQDKFNVREAILLKNEEEYEEKKQEYINNYDEMNNKNKVKYAAMQESKKELMKKFIEQEKEIKKLKSQNIELDEKYNILLEDDY